MRGWPVDASQALKDAENVLRDFIALALESEFGADWPAQCGVSAERIARWQERRGVEERRQAAGAVEERLLYYADFYDLRPILKKHWDKFAAALGDWKTMDVWLSELEKLRDPDAHRRELLPHQKALAVGISGEIRNRIIRFRSKLETAEDCFPRIECSRDSLGNVATHRTACADTKLVLRPGDVIEYVVTASDPLGGQLEYRLLANGRGPRHNAWQSDNVFRLEIGIGDIRQAFQVTLQVRSQRDYHARGETDDVHVYGYRVYPRN